MARSAGRDLELPDALTAADPQATATRITQLASLTGDLIQGAVELSGRAVAAGDSAAATLKETARGLESSHDWRAAAVA